MPSGAAGAASASDSSRAGDTTPADDDVRADDEQSRAGAGGAGQGHTPQEAAPTWARDEDIGFYGRARFLISSGGVAPEWGVVIKDGPLIPRALLQGSMLVVGFFDDTVRSTTTGLDPREVHGTPDPASGMAFGAMLDEGSFTFSFPGQHVETEAHLRASRFEVYVVGNVPYDIAVTPDNVDALRAGATLLGSVEGADMHELFFE